MGGQIWVESALGCGSTLHFTARFGLPDAPEPEPESMGILHGSHDAVLVVDDNATHRRLLTALLSRWGLRPTSVEGVQDALSALQQAQDAGHPFALVLLDTTLPAEDSVQLAQQITTTPALAGACIVTMSPVIQRASLARWREMEGDYLCDEASGAIGTLGGYHNGVGPTGSHDAVDVIGSRLGEHL